MLKSAITNTISRLLYKTVKVEVVTDRMSRNLLCSKSKRFLTYTISHIFVHKFVLAHNDTLDSTLFWDISIPPKMEERTSEKNSTLFGLKIGVKFVVLEISQRDFSMNEEMNAYPLILFIHAVKSVLEKEIETGRFFSSTEITLSHFVIGRNIIITLNLNPPCVS